MRRALPVLLLAVCLAAPLVAGGAKAEPENPVWPETSEAPGPQDPAHASKMPEPPSDQGPAELDPPPFVVEDQSRITMGKTPAGFQYVLYSENEFAPWQKKLRRGEALFFGGLPLSFAAVGLVCSIFNIREDFWPMLGVSAAISAAISIADFIVGESEAARDRETLR